MKNFDIPSPPDSFNEKEIKLAEVRNRVDKIADGLGRGIDEGIKDSVVAFMVHDFPTDDSCEGHLTNEEGGRKFLLPRVTVYAPAPEGWKESEEKQKQWSKENEVYRKRIDELLEEFYTDRDATDEYRLVAHPKGIFNAFTIASVRCKENINPEENEKDVLDRARQEIADFTDFLMDKFGK